MKAKLFLILVISAFTLLAANAQHYIGLKDAYGITNASTAPDLEKKSISSVFNPGIVYRYEHKKYFAIQAEFDYISKGYKTVDETSQSQSTNSIYAYELPILAQGFVRFGRFRPYLTGGAFMGYITKREVWVDDGPKEPYKYDSYDNRFEYGIIGGIGAGFAFTNRIELQAEWRYQYDFSFLRDPHINGVSQYYNSTQMMISLTLFYRIH